jgi:hypothetical protein
VLSLKEFEDLTMEDIDYDKPMVFKDWKRFYIKNPWVYDWYVDRIRELWIKGIRKYSIYFLTEKLRWEYKQRPDSNSQFKFTSSFCPVYARYIMYKIPVLEGFFEIRGHSIHIYKKED